MNPEECAKQAAPQAPDSQLKGDAGIGYSPYRRPTPLEEMEKRQADINRQSDLLWQGTNFLREFPQFNRFIELIRIGAISF